MSYVIPYKNPQSNIIAGYDPDKGISKVYIDAGDAKFSIDLEAARKHPKWAEVIKKYTNALYEKSIDERADCLYEMYKELAKLAETSNNNSNGHSQVNNNTNISVFAEPNTISVKEIPMAHSEHASPQVSTQFPTLRVTFMIEGSPVQFEGYYHHIIRSGVALIFVLDKQSFGMPRTIPTVLENPDTDIKLKIDGQPMVFVCRYYGLSFEFEGHIFFIYLIRDEYKEP